MQAGFAMPRRVSAQPKAAKKTVRQVQKRRRASSTEEEIEVEKEGKGEPPRRSRRAAGRREASDIICNSEEEGWEN